MALVVKKPLASAGDTRDASLIRGSPGGGNGNPHQCSSLEFSMDRSLAGDRPQGCNESDMMEATEHACNSLQVFHF